MPQVCKRVHVGHCSGSISPPCILVEEGLLKIREHQHPLKQDCGPHLHSSLSPIPGLGMADRVVTSGWVD